MEKEEGEKGGGWLIVKPQLSQNHVKVVCFLGRPAFRCSPVGPAYTVRWGVGFLLFLLHEPVPARLGGWLWVQVTHNTDQLQVCCWLLKRAPHLLRDVLHNVIMNAVHGWEKNEKGPPDRQPASQLSNEINQGPREKKKKGGDERGGEGILLEHHRLVLTIHTLSP